MRARRSQITGLLGWVTAVLLGAGCGGGEASETNGSHTGGSGGGSSTGGLPTTSGGDAGTMSGGSTSSGGTGGSTASGGTGGVCSWEMGLPGPPGLTGWGWMSEMHDMNGDGIPDLLASIGNPDGTLHVRLGDGSGGFGAPIATVAANQAISVKVAEMNGDGIPDVIAFGTYDPFFEVLTGNGDGSFVVNAPIPTLANPSGYFLVDDLSGDGRADVAIDAGMLGLQVWLQTAAGTLGAPASYALPTPDYVGLHAADMNGDGARELVWAAPGNGGGCDFWTLANTGNGTFGAPKKLGVPCADGGLALADLNGDGRTDVVTGGAPAEKLAFLQKANGTFGPGLDVGLHPTGASLSLVDLNGDGHVDALTTEEVRFGAGDGTFPTHQDLFLTGRALATADLDVDGHTDLVAVYRGLVTPVLARSDGSLAQPVKINDTLVGLKDIELGDLGGDGIVDLALAGDDGLRIAEGQADGSFSDPASLDLGAGTDVAMLDVNGDQRLDLVVVAASSAYLSTYLQQAGGTFSPAGDTALPWVGARLVTADLNGDGLGDLVVKPKAPVWHSGLHLLFGQGDGQFSAAEIQANDGYGDAVVGDVDNDGSLDIVASTAGPPIHVLRGHGDGTFEPPTDVGSTYGSTLLLTDLDADGALDLVERHWGGPLQTLHNQGDGTFGEAVPVFQLTWDSILSDDSEDLSAYDVNGDGVLDLVTHQSPSIFVCLGQGDGTLGTCVGYPSCATTANIAASDWNGDGRTDLFLACQSSPGIARLTSTTCMP
ncbi:MAG: VCBS repeat-containing protein [Polyangiaceae bacterium]